MPVQLSPFYTYQTGYPRKTIVRDAQTFEGMIRFLSDARVLFWDFETSGLDYFKRARACGLALGAYDAEGAFHGYYTPFRHDSGEDQLDIAVIGPAFQRLLANPVSVKCGHNLKFDDHFARREGWGVYGPRYDTMIAARLSDENRSMALKYRAKTDLGFAQADEWELRLDNEVKRLAKANGMGVTVYKNRYGYSQVNQTMLGIYACFDVDFTAGLHTLYERDGLSQQYGRIWPTEMELTEVLCSMEEAGLLIDVEHLTRLRKTLGDRTEIIEKEIRHVTGGAKFNIASDDELREFLQRGLGLHLTKLTDKKQLSVDREVLKSFLGAHPAVGLILDWREAEKLYSTYTQSILDRLDDRGYLHPDYQQVGTDTGRMSCKSPNFQNISADSDARAQKHSGKRLEEGGTDPWSIRRAFLNRGPGWVRLYFDYSQVELRVLAHYSQDPVMVAAYINGEDIHSRTSLEVFGTAEKAKRRLAKVINFGLCVAEGQRVLTQQDGLVPIERVRDHHLLWDGVEWVRHRGLICRGVEEVLTYDGLTATPDHVVYTRHGGRTTLRDAASSFYPRRLAVGAIGEIPIGYAAIDWEGGQATAYGEDSAGGGGALHGLWKDKMGACGQHQGGAYQKLQLPTGQVPGFSGGSFGAALRRYGAALRERYALLLAELQGARNSGLVPVEGAFYLVGAGAVPGYRFPGVCVRSDQQRWGLFSGEFAVDHSADQRKQRPEVARVYDLLDAGPRHRFTVEGKIVSNSYGLSPVGFSRQVGVPKEEAEGYFQKFFERYAGITQFRQRFWGEVRKRNGHFLNLFGRPRRVWGINASKGYERGVAERQAIATLIQGTAAELTKESLVRISRGIRERGFEAHLVATIHDEIQVDCRVDDMPEVARMVKVTMEAFPEFQPIPIVVDASWSVTDWSEKKGIK